jgi:hypothetical protein
MTRRSALDLFTTSVQEGDQRQSHREMKNRSTEAQITVVETRPSTRTVAKAFGV